MKDPVYVSEYQNAQEEFKTGLKDKREQRSNSRSSGGRSPKGGAAKLPMKTGAAALVEQSNKQAKDVK